MNIDRYVQKLGLAKRPPSLTALNEIIRVHQNLVSFNNLAVYFRPKVLLNLELDALFEKVVARREGGYCFENNKLFFYLLKGLGYEVTARAARVRYNQMGDIPRTHRTAIVTIEGLRYLADVGFGRDVPNVAIPLSGERAGEHSIVKSDSEYYLQLHKKDEVITLYSFDEGQYQESDFMLANYYTNTHPDSKFVKELMMVRKSPDILEIINGRTYSRIANGERWDSEIKSQSEFEQYLKHFGIEHPYAEYRLDKI